MTSNEGGKMQKTGCSVMLIGIAITIIAPAMLCVVLFIIGMVGQ